MQWDGGKAFSSWRTQWRPLLEVIAATQPTRIRLTLADSSVLVLEHPVILADSIIGLKHEARSAVASTRIVRTEIREVNAWKMLAWVCLYIVVYQALGGDPGG